MMALFNFVIQKLEDRKERLRRASLPLQGGAGEVKL